jgi:hypothetical protein
MDKVIADIRSFIDSQVREGFKSVHEIVENTTHYALETFGYDDLHSVGIVHLSICRLL